MRYILFPLIVAALATPALAGPTYEPVKLDPAGTVSPPDELVAAAAAFLDTVKSGDVDAMGAGIADSLTLIYGPLEMALPRRKEIAGPFKTAEEKLVALSAYIGGDVESDSDGNPILSNQIEAARQYIEEALTNGLSWGADPMVEGAICSYSYRSYDRNAVKRLADKMDEQSSALFYVDAPVSALKAADAQAGIAATLAPDLLYVEDYKTDTPIYWHAIHLPDGGSGFISFEAAQLEKPYAGGVCFAKNKAGAWQMVAQVATGL